MPPASDFLQYRLKKPYAPVWLIGYITHNMQHGEFAKSRKREYSTIIVHVNRVEGAGERIGISMLLVVVYRKSESRKSDSMFHHYTPVAAVEAAVQAVHWHLLHHATSHHMQN